MSAVTENQPPSSRHQGPYGMAHTDPSEVCVQERCVVLQKQDNEGFGFVLRGAKADVPVAEFEPSAAFPALQYLEKVDAGGVADRAGLTTGAFIVEVNGKNVVKSGHRDVVNVIRHSGNRLAIKTVTVTRVAPPTSSSTDEPPTTTTAEPPATDLHAGTEPGRGSNPALGPTETEGTTGSAAARKKAAPPPPPKRSPGTVLTLKSKSVADELAELEKLDEMLADEVGPMGDDGSKRGAPPATGYTNLTPAQRLHLLNTRSPSTKPPTPCSLAPRSAQDFPYFDLVDTSDIPPPPTAPPPEPPELIGYDEEEEQVAPPPPPAYAPPPTPTGSPPMFDDDDATGFVGELPPVPRFAPPPPPASPPHRPPPQPPQPPEPPRHPPPHRPDETVTPESLLRQHQQQQHQQQQRLSTFNPTAAYRVFTTTGGEAVSPARPQPPPPPPPPAPTASDNRAAADVSPPPPPQSPPPPPPVKTAAAGAEAARLGFVGGGNAEPLYAGVESAAERRRREVDRELAAVAGAVAAAATPAAATPAAAQAAATPEPAAAPQTSPADRRKREEKPLAATTPVPAPVAAAPVAAAPVAAAPVAAPTEGRAGFVHPVTGQPLDPGSPMALILAARQRAMNRSKSRDDDLVVGVGVVAAAVLPAPPPSPPPVEEPTFEANEVAEEEVTAKEPDAELENKAKEEAVVAEEEEVAVEEVAVERAVEEQAVEEQAVEEEAVEEEAAVELPPLPTDAASAPGVSDDPVPPPFQFSSSSLAADDDDEPEEAATADEAKSPQPPAVPGGVPASPASSPARLRTTLPPDPDRRHTVRIVPAASASAPAVPPSPTTAAAPTGFPTAATTGIPATIPTTIPTTILTTTAAATSPNFVLSGQNRYSHGAMPWRSGGGLSGRGVGGPPPTSPKPPGLAASGPVAGPKIGDGPTANSGGGGGAVAAKSEMLSELARRVPRRGSFAGGSGTERGGGGGGGRQEEEVEAPVPTAATAARGDGYGATFSIRPNARQPMVKVSGDATDSPHGQPARAPSTPKSPGVPRNQPEAPKQQQQYQQYQQQQPAAVTVSPSQSPSAAQKFPRVVPDDPSAHQPSAHQPSAQQPSAAPPQQQVTPFSQRPLGAWSKLDVAAWLDSLGLSEHRARFLENEIDGSHLPVLSRDDFSDLGVTRVGHRKNIEQAVKALLR